MTEKNTETVAQKLTRLAHVKESKTRLISVKVKPSVEREIIELSKIVCAENGKSYSDFLRHLLISGLWAQYEKHHYSNAQAAVDYADNVVDNKNYDEILQVKMDILQTKIINTLNEKLDVIHSDLDGIKSKKWWK